MTTDLRKLPAASERLDTGPIQFGDDWPGVFVRGDSALILASMFRQAADDAQAYWLDRDFPRTVEFERFIKLRIMAMKNWADLFEACAFNKAPAA